MAIAVRAFAKTLLAEPPFTADPVDFHAMMTMSVATVLVTKALVAADKPLQDDNKNPHF